MVSRGARITSTKYSQLLEMLGGAANLPESSFIDSLTKNINGIDIEKIRSLTVLFSAARRASTISKVGESIQKAFGIVGASNGKKDVVEEYKKLTKKEKQDENYRKYISTRAGSSRLESLKEQYGKHAYGVFKTQFANAIRTIDNPDYQNLLDLKHEWGAKKGLDLYKKERENKAEKLWNRHRKSERMSGIAADQAFKYDMMDDFDQMVHDFTKRYHGDSSKADAKIRKELEKNLPSFFKGSNLSTKELHNISKAIAGTGRLPIIGGFAQGMMMNPMMTAISGLITLTNSSISATKTVTSWENAGKYSGTPSEKLRKAMKSAGVGNEGDVNAKYGAMTSWLAALQIGDKRAYDVIADVAIGSGGKIDLSSINPHSTPEELISTIAPQLKNLNFNERLNTINALHKIGIDKNVMRAGEYYAGTEKVPYENEKMGIIQEILDSQKKAFSNRPWDPTTWLYQIPVLGEFAAAADAAVEMAYNDATRKLGMPLASNDMFSIAGTQAASFFIQNMSVNANDAKEFKDSMQKESESRSNKNTLRQMRGGMH